LLQKFASLCLICGFFAEWRTPEELFQGHSPSCEC
jgi:hypothetical protein